jgi:membrane protein
VPGVDRYLRGAEHDLEEFGDDAHEAARRHPRIAAIVALVTDTMREQSAEQVGLAASGAAFWLVISALPTAIAVVSLFGLAVSPERVASDLGTLANNAPSSLGALLTQQLRKVAASDHAGLSLGFAVSFLLAVWSASAGVWNLDRAIRVGYGLPPQSYVEARARALLGALVVVIMLGLSAIAASIAEARASTLFGVLGVPVALLAATVGVGALYRFAIGRPVALRRLVPGAVTSAIGVLVASFGFGAYVAVSTRYTAVYGAFAGIVVVMLAVYLAVYVVLIGAVLNMQLGRSQPGTAEHPRPAGN